MKKSWKKVVTRNLKQALSRRKTKKCNPQLRLSRSLIKKIMKRKPKLTQIQVKMIN